LNNDLKIRVYIFLSKYTKKTNNLIKNLVKTHFLYLLFYAFKKIK